jgi:hypothetical protein
MTRTRTIVIGDLHGCYQEALSLLEKLEVTATDRVIFTGDLVDRGPNPRECVELAMQHECILGNHEEKHLHYQKYYNAGSTDILPDHQRTRSQLAPQHYDYFKSLPLYIRLPEYKAVVVHAGVYPGFSIENQPASLLLHGQCIKPSQSGTPSFKSYWPSKAPADTRFWVHFWRGPERVIFGHTVLDKPLVSKYAVGIDTGAVFGRRLTAIVLPDWEIVSVPAHVDPSRPTNNNSRSRVSLYPLLDGVSTFS